MNETTLHRSEHNLVWIDLEMTGLDPVKERIIEHLGTLAGGSDTGRNVQRALSRLDDVYEPSLALLVKKGLATTEPGKRAGSVIVRLVTPAAEGGVA